MRELWQAGVYGVVQDESAQQRSFATDRDIALQVLETQRDGVIVVDGDWRVRFVNRSYEEHSGLSRARILDRTLWELLSESAGQSSVYRRYLSQAMEERAEVGFDAYFPPYRRRTFIKAHPGPDGGLIILHRDTAARRGAELALEEARDYLRLLVESLAEGVFGIDPKGRCTFINRAGLRMLGYNDAASVIGKHMHRLIHHSHADGSRYSFRDCPTYRAVRGGEAQRNMLTTFWRADGSSFLARESTEPVLRGGMSVGAVTIFSDVTAQVQQENRARWLEQAGQLLAAEVTDYDQLLTRLGELVVPQVADWYAVDLVEPDGATRLAAVAHEDPEKIILAREYRDRYPPGSGSPLGVYAAIQSGEPQFVPAISDDMLRAVAQDAEHLDILRTLGIRAGMVLPLFARGRVIGALTLIASRPGKLSTTEEFAFAKELAARAALAIDNARLYDEVKRAVAVREDVLALVSHDLKSPLRAVSLTAATLLRRAKTEPQRRLLQNILQASDRMERLIEDLLDMAQLRAGCFSIVAEPVIVKPLLQEAVDVQTPLALAKGIDMRAKLALEDDLQINGNRSRLIRAIDNLLGNAIKFCEAGCSVALRAEADETAVYIEIEDNGPGIAPELLPKLFTAYWSASEHRTMGTGLGLYICKGIIEAHGGEIDVRSEPGRGTTFSIRLPRSEGGQTIAQR